MRAFLLLTTFFIAQLCVANDIDAFAAFEKEDAKNFSSLKSQIQSCIENKNFQCAEKKLQEIKQYVSTKKDSQTIAYLQNRLQEEENYQQEIANANKSISIRNCRPSSGGKNLCNLYVNGKYDGNIFYYNRDDSYIIFILGSKNARNIDGAYRPSLHDVWTTECKSSVFDRSDKIMVYQLSDALFLYANCAINGKYR